MQQSGERNSAMDAIEETPGGSTVSTSRKDRDEFFDASQYAFFGGNVSDEVELGGLDEEDGGEQLEDGEESNDGLADRDLSAAEAAPEWDSVSDLTASFSKLNSSPPKRDEASRGGLDEGRRFLAGRDGAAQPDRFEGGPPGSWLDRPTVENEVEAGARKWWPNHQHQSVQGLDFDGAPMGPPAHQQPGQNQPQQQRWWGGDPSLAHLSPPNPMAGSYPPSRQPHQRSATPPGPQGGQYRQSMGAPPPVQHIGGVIPSHMVYGSGQSQFSAGHMLPPAQPQGGPWAQRPIGSGGPGNSLPQQMPLMPPQVMLQQYHRQQGPLQSSPPLPYAQMPYGGSPPPGPGPDHRMQQAMNEVGMGREFWDQREQRFDPQFRPRQPQHRFHQQNHPSEGGHGGRGGPNGWQQFRSKYMTADEIENIVRIQWAATHGSDPYIDDYYHQAVQAKLAGGTPHGRRHFAPSHPREMPSHARAAAEPHAFLQVDALGRVPYSSIRRPRPLLEVDAARSDGMNMNDHMNGDFGMEGMVPQRPLEQEPMLAARIAIEDGLCLLLDVDDIDRLLAVQQLPDNGATLRRRRQILLEGLASSLQLADPLGNSPDMGNRINGRFVGNPKDDLVFLRLVSLPKGKKLLTRYLQLLNPGSELVQIVCMAVSRHLKFLFNGPQSDVGAAATTAALANSVALAVLSMDLPSLSGCLLSVVLASETTPLRPMGAPAGDGATVILRNILERANTVRRDRHAFYSPQNLTIWQHAFDAFFSILTKYCTNKYDSVIHSLMMLYPGNIPAINAAADEALKKEIPVELLQATLAHTSEHQRKLLYELITNRAGAMSGIPNGGNSADSHASNTATVRG